MTIPVGTKLGPYEILAPLGSGGMGEVYRARDIRLERDVAIKVVPERIRANPAALARFETEAKVLAALSHPNLLSIFDFGNENGLAYAVTELLEGQTLRARLLRSSLPWRRAIDVAAAAAEGLSAAHARGIVHRDLKPENLFLTSNGSVKILDFGLASRGAPAASAGCGSGTADTVVRAAPPRNVEGTSGYMSPEQVGGFPADARSDIFTLGAVLYEMITGRRAFPGSPIEAMAAVTCSEPRAIGDSEAPPTVDRVIRRCLEKSPDARFASARELAFALRTAVEPPREARIRSGRLVRTSTRAAVLAAVLGTALFGWLRSRPPAKSRDAGIHSVAVLPLANLSGDASQDYFADGMTDELTTELSKIASLRVISHTSALAFRGTHKLMPQIARELGVDTVVEGSASRNRETVRITAQLIDALHDRHLWAESYEREVGDIPGVESAVALEIARQIRVHLTVREQQNLRHAPVDPEAYDAYLRGRYSQTTQTADSLKAGLPAFQQAINLDPTYAPAYAGLADTYSLLANYGVLSPREAFPQAQAAATKSLNLDSGLAEAHTARAYPEHHYTWEWAKAEREYRTAIALSPSYANAHLRYAEYLSSVGRHGEAVEEMRRAMTLDPLSLVYSANLGRFLYHARRYDEAIETLKRTLALDPNRTYARVHLAMCFEQRGMYAEASREFDKVTAAFGGRLGPGIAHFYALTGQSNKARPIAEKLRRDAGDSDWFFLAGVYAALGDKETAFGCLDRAYETHDFFLVFLGVHPYMDPLRGDPRYGELMKRMGLA